MFEGATSDDLSRDMSDLEEIKTKLQEALDLIDKLSYCEKGSEIFRARISAEESIGFVDDYTVTLEESIEAKEKEESKEEEEDSEEDSEDETPDEE